MQPLIAVNGLRKRFNLEAGFFASLGRYVYAVNGLSFSIGRNESYGLAGESGCGKTTAARLLVRMYDYDDGTIRYRGDDIASYGKKELRRYRQKVKYVFQDPSRSLNPRMSVYDVLVSGRRWADDRAGEKKLREEAAVILEEVGLSAKDLERRPAEFSGGQRQRISIARGLLMRPELLICDEVVSALDVSIQAQILNLLMDIRRRRALSFLFIAHDLKVACWFCDRIGIMYRGELMEEAPAADLYKTAAHPYTRLLFSSVLNGEKSAHPEGGAASPRPADSAADGAPAGGSPVSNGTPLTAGEPPVSNGAPDVSGGRFTGTALKGEVRTALEEITGCAFAERCPHAMERCFREKPELRETAPGRKIRCFNSAL